MGDRDAQGIALHQREGRARHLKELVVGDGADQRPRKGRLPGTEVAEKGDQVTGPDGPGDVLAEADGLCLVGEMDGADQHGPIPRQRSPASVPMGCGR